MRIQRLKVRNLVYTLSLFTIAGISLASVPKQARAGILLTIEGPGIQASSVPGVTTETFNSLTPGIKTSYSSPIGEYSGQFAIVSPDSYGGADQTKYLAIGAESHSTSTTLNLGQDRAYFGLFWSAGDKLNELDFYENSTLVGVFRTVDVINTINQLSNKTAYYGNPNTRQDISEPFAYLNFYGQNGTVFNDIVFRNDSTATGFESDNQSVRTAAVVNPTGIVVGVPEPSSILILSSGIVGVAFYCFRSRKRPRSTGV